MKLNLLPTYVKKDSQGRTAIIGAIVLGVVGFIACVFMIVLSGQTLDHAKAAEADARTRADEANKESQKADAIMAASATADVVRNLALAKAMAAHNTVYPDVYDTVRSYIPPYFRITSLSAAPASDTTCTVTMTGVVGSYQQYADLMLALLRIPGASNVSRSGYQLDAAYVPSLTPDDQTGRPVKPGEQNIPDDGIERLHYLEAQGATSGYLGVNNFGGDPDQTRGAMPGASLITVQVTIPGNLMTPDPRATLSSAGSAAGGTTTAAVGAAGGFGGPGGGAPAGAASPAPRGGGAGKKSKGDDE